MNKTEVLVALLEKARQWERVDAEVRVPGWEGEVLAALDRNVARLTDLREDEEFGVGSNTPDVAASLITIGAAALYLLVDEVEVVTGRSLEEWLADNRDRAGNGERSKLRARPQPINGDMSGRPVRVHTDPSPGGWGMTQWP